MREFLFVVIIVIIIGSICEHHRENNTITSDDLRRLEQTGESDPFSQREKFEPIPNISPSEFDRLLEETALDNPNLAIKGDRLSVVQYSRPKRYKFVFPQSMPGDVVCMSRAANNFYLDVKAVADLRSFGGVKLLSDFSAQASGIFNVNDVKAGQVIYFYPPGSWGLEIPWEDEQSIFSHLKKKQITILSATIE